MALTNLRSNSSAQLSSAQLRLNFAFFYSLCLPFNNSLNISYFKANLRLVLSAYYKYFIFQGVKLCEDLI